MNGALSRVADNTFQVPNAAGTFQLFSTTVNDGERIVFHSGNGSVTGIYQRSAGALSRIVDTQMTAPNGGQFVNAENPSVEGASIAFFGANRPQQTALPAVYRWDNGVITTVADTATPVPGGTGSFQNLSTTSVRLDHGAAWFRGVDSANKSGIYRRTGQGLQAVIDTNTDGPAGMGKFTSLVEFGPDGDDVLFRGATEIGNPTPGGLFTRLNGQITKLVSTGDPAPGGGAFGTMTSLSLENGVAVFYDNTNSVIYTNFGGTLQRIIGTGDTLDGKTISRVNFVPQGRDGNVVGFSVRFTDHAPPGTYSEAIYLVTLPAPGALLPFAGAVLCASRRRRRDLHRGSAVLRTRPLFTLWADDNNYIEFRADCKNLRFEVRTVMAGATTWRQFGGADQLWLPNSQFYAVISKKDATPPNLSKELYFGASLGGGQVADNSSSPVSIAHWPQSNPVFTELRFRGRPTTTPGDAEGSDEVVTMRWVGGEIRTGTGAAFGTSAAIKAAFSDPDLVWLKGP